MQKIICTTNFAVFPSGRTITYTEFFNHMFLTFFFFYKGKQSHRLLPLRGKAGNWIRRVIKNSSNLDTNTDVCTRICPLPWTSTHTFTIFNPFPSQFLFWLTTTLSAYFCGLDPRVCVGGGCCPNPAAEVRNKTCFRRKKKKENTTGTTSRSPSVHKTQFVLDCLFSNQNEFSFLNWPKPTI